MVRSGVCRIVSGLNQWVMVAVKNALSCSVDNGLEDHLYVSLRRIHLAF